MMSGAPNSQTNPNSKPPSSAKRRRRNLPGTPDPDAEVIALSPKTLMATNRFVCEICNKGFQRDQNLQLHRRGHNLPWKLKQRANKHQIKKKVYICPEKTCVHHEPGRALGDLTGIKKHFSRKHGEKKWKCDKCSKKYAVQSDWKAHSKTCGTREYKCDCGTLFPRKDSFIKHRAFCDALAEESAVATNNLNLRNDFDGNMMNQGENSLSVDQNQQKPRLSLWLDQANSQLNHIDHNSNTMFMPSSTGLTDMIQMASNVLFGSNSSMGNKANTATMADSLASTLYSDSQNSGMSATALLQKAAQIGSTKSSSTFFGNTVGVMNSSSPSASSTNTLPYGPPQTELHQVFGENPAGAMMNFNNNLGNAAQGANSVSLHSGLHGFTRDFLGMGGDGGGTFLPQELAKFASMSPAMGLTHFTTNHY
ncbi:zinc finger protein JACKDAW-like [Salvia splendens]|uniref:zinc finger protein JACKDAW-like n=1 Tax=Salvia splendens TaxID=180675 RepID=UPI001C25FF70|nr:zinc finger protein JACKDAW-like [Salvia splendens]